MIVYAIKKDNQILDIYRHKGEALQRAISEGGMAEIIMKRLKGGTKMNDSWKLALDVDDKEFGFELYTKLAQRTSSTAKTHNKMDNGIMGLIGETGECVDIYKKHLFQGHDLNEDKIRDELSDILWYCAELSTGMGYTLAEVLSWDDFDSFGQYLDSTLINGGLLRSFMQLSSSVGKISGAYHGGNSSEMERDTMYFGIRSVVCHLHNIAKDLGTDLKTVAEYNVEKLYKRYPEGFSADKSINREV